MRIEISIFDQDGNPRPFADMTQDLLEKVMVAGMAFYESKSAACASFKIGRSTMYRRTKPKAPPRPKPLPPVTYVPTVKIVSDVAYLDAKARFDPSWPAERDNKLRELYTMHLSPGAIAMDMGCSVLAVEKRLAKLGLRPSAYKMERENAL